MEYIDLYLIHFPGSPYSDPKNKKHAKLRRESWLALVKLYDESKVRAIGVSNFTIRHLMELSEVMAVGPMVNQVMNITFLHYIINYINNSLNNATKLIFKYIFTDRMASVLPPTRDDSILLRS